jgi:hypothetical protein
MIKYMLVFLAGWIISVPVYIYWDNSEPEPTCEYIELKQKAFEMCLRHRPTCAEVTVEDFIAYYEQKNWLDAHCPANSGDGFLSQNN